MQQISIRNQFGSLIRTVDGAFDDPVGRILAAVRNSLGPVSAADAARLESTLRKYAGGSDGTTVDTALLRANREAQKERLQGIAKANADFWDQPEEARR